MKISATVITLNEERNIRAALESLYWADEIIVVDSNSTDRTVEIAREFTTEVHVRQWPGYSAQKTFAAEVARHDWIFNLDADERVSDELAGELLALKENDDPPAAGYEMPRATFYLGRWIKHAGWYPDFKLRLYDRRRGRWKGDYVHESVEVDGPAERLSGEILHKTVESASEHHLRMDKYTTLAALELHARGRRASASSILISPVVAFIRSYFLKLGFLDRVPGLAISLFAAHYAFLKQLKLWELSATEKAKARAAKG
ncbi:MAG TPA: glycosyltransferase family 2 protein [Blastocatellia bacterium]|jgi:glycosyltransferase involved in cell wall biosynthesis|nr:glycosyltransferase family 2 protein [Blastocatellia bacterium]